MRFDRAAVLPLLFFLSCSDGPTGPSEDPSVAFGTASLHLGEARSAFIVVRNTGQIAVGPIEVFAQPVMKAGLELPGVEVLSAPDEIPTLNPGDSAVIELTVALATMLQPGTYEAPLRARVQGRTLASAVLLFDVAVPPGLVGRIQITSAPDGLRQGDVAHFSAAVFDTLDQIVPDAVVTWSATPGSGIFFEPGVFVPYSTGVTRVIAASGSVADTLAYDVSVRSGRGDFTVVGHTPLLSRFTSDLWVHGDVAYTGTWGSRQEPGNMMYAWNVSGPDPELTDSVRIVAFTVDDVMIRADGKLAIITHEYASPSHAITLVDMSDPEHPTVAGEFHSDIVGAEWIGVHNAWLDGDYAYIVVDGATANRGLWILDVSDPANPVRVARFWGGSSFLHDVIVRDGLAFLSHWNAGLIILDVGNGIRGGSPTSPVEVSRIITTGGDVHNAWYWPEKGYVFLGEEDWDTPGWVHVVDVSDITHPVEVASLRVAGDTPHNFWLDEANEILYTSWYSRGVQAVDVSGELRGNLDLQGRIIARSTYAGEGGCADASRNATCSWGTQLHEGYVYVADMNTGLWKLQANLP